MLNYLKTGQHSRAQLARMDELVAELQNLRANPEGLNNTPPAYALARPILAPDPSPHLPPVPLDLPPTGSQARYARKKALLVGKLGGAVPPAFHAARVRLSPHVCHALPLLPVLSSGSHL